MEQVIMQCLVNLAMTCYVIKSILTFITQCIYVDTLQITFVFNGHISFSSKSSLQKRDIMLAPSASPIMLIVVLKRSLKNNTFSFYW